MRNRFIGGVLALGLVVPATAGAQEKATVGYYPGALISMPALVASEQKFFEKNGLNVELVPVASGPAMTSAVASGSVTFVNNSWDNLILAVDKGLPVRAVTGSTVKVPFALIVRKGVPLPDLAKGYPAVIKDLLARTGACWRWACPSISWRRPS
jgi:NitT/TauT family transport system substrate-binding protein